ncbi:uncharacterized protein EI90DRAFT_664468 [Cantharellus anzutake]|uniref:uncharacterized protein n=1 Tax=Cantharellus anzutake TaxID=1750568 RepID=UPI0019055DC7|nr:uncharacterized protein EI90DRAFT_664468 [Cantharellus anzutake]KAF8312428.1 hypothetical protein EI90DRAFT_664468 [Cantharellus anzutake]
MNSTSTLLSLWERLWNELNIWLSGWWTDWSVHIPSVERLVGHCTSKCTSFLFDCISLNTDAMLMNYLSFFVPQFPIGASWIAWRLTRATGSSTNCWFDQCPHHRKSVVHARLIILQPLSSTRIFVRHSPNPFPGMPALKPCSCPSAPVLLLTNIPHSTVVPRKRCMCT